MNIYFKSTVSLFTILVLGVVVFPLIEARLVSAANTATVVARQQVSAEIALTVASNEITLSPAIPGLSGGTGNGNTVVTIITGNNGGYTVTIQASGTVAAMVGDTQGGRIVDYAATLAETWTDTTSGQASQFGFGVTNTSLSSANSATGYSTCTGLEDCWSKAPTTTAKTIINVNISTPSGGDTFTLKFRAHVPANTTPLVPEDWYSATTTVTALAT